MGQPNTNLRVILALVALVPSVSTTRSARSWNWSWKWKWKQPLNRMFPAITRLPGSHEHYLRIRRSCDTPCVEEAPNLHRTGFALGESPLHSPPPRRGSVCSTTESLRPRVPPPPVAGGSTVLYISRLQNRRFARRLPHLHKSSTQTQVPVISVHHTYSC